MSVKSYQLQASPFDGRKTNDGAYSTFNKPRMYQSTVWDLSNSSALKQSFISTCNGREPTVELQRVPVLSYCFEKYTKQRNRGVAF